MNKMGRNFVVGSCFIIIIYLFFLIPLLSEREISLKSN